MKVEKGVMVVKDGKGWGCLYNDGKSFSEGWRSLENAEIHDPRFCTKPTDVTYRDSPYIHELITAKLVKVERITQVRIIPDSESDSPSCS